MLLNSPTNIQHFFESIRGRTSFSDVVVAAVTHIVPDRRLFLPALNAVAPIELVIGIPYSVDQDTRHELDLNYKIILPTPNDLQNKDFIVGSVKSLPTCKRIVLIDIGGYFSCLLQDGAHLSFPNLVGIIEDTENGHKKYADIRSLPIPVLSVARSALKISEDINVGQSVLFSLERILREQNEIFQPRTCLVMGFGKVGKGIAMALRARHARVLVYDVDPSRRIEALGWGFSIPDRVEALRAANIILGATGRESVTSDDLQFVANGTILASASSKNVEFPIEYLRAKFSTINKTSSFEKFDVNGNQVVVMYGGHPLNFRDNGVVGPFLLLSQAEIIACVSVICNGAVEIGLREIPSEQRSRVAKVWLEHFVGGGEGVIL